MSFQNDRTFYRVHTPATIQVSSLKRSKGITAYAVAPNGERLPIKVTEADGVYSTNFTPYETGEWQVHILDGKEHIEGSPFQVHVQEVKKIKISGLETTIIGREVNLQVEAASDDLEKLSVKVKVRGQEVDCRIRRISSNQMSLTFRPRQPSTYLVHVYLDGEEIKDSPFQLEVRDAGGVVVTGVGITEAPTHQPSVFYVNIGREGSRNDLEVVIKSPKNSNVPLSIRDNGSGNLSVIYTPQYTGEHRIEILYFDRHVSGSPFYVNVFDPEKVVLANVPAECILHETVAFDIDASSAGSGNLEISINGGDCVCEVEELGKKRFKAIFTPTVVRPHFISVNFNKIPVPGSPCCVQVIRVSSLTYFEGQQNLFPIGQPLEFNLQSDQSDLDFMATVKGPSGIPMKADIIPLQNKLFRIRYIPLEIGNHLIVFASNRNGAARAKPFLFKVFDVSAVVVSPVNAGMVGSAVNFTVDASHAGEGQLEISIDRGSTPHTTLMYSKGKFLVSFTPTAPGFNVIDILFNGQVLAQCPINVPVLDLSVLAKPQEPESASRSVVNKSATFRLQRQQKDFLQDDITLKVVAPNGEVVPSRLLLEENGDYKVEYSSHCTGRHAVDIRQAGVSISGSPFFVEIFDPSKIKIVGSKSGEVGYQMEIDVNCAEAGKADLKLQILSPRGHKVPFEVFKTSEGEHIRYVPREIGVYTVSAMYGGLTVPGPPIKQQIIDTRMVTAVGEGLILGFEDKEAKFRVDSGGQEGELSVRVEGPKSVARGSIDKISEHQFVVGYTPAEVGFFNVNIKWNGKEIPDSPFHPTVINPSKIFLVGGWEPYLDSQKNLALPNDRILQLVFDVGGAGPGSLKVEIDDGTGFEPVPISVLDPSHVRVNIMPRQEGVYGIRFRWKDTILQNCPSSAICRKNSRKSSSDITEATTSTTALQSRQHITDNIKTSSVFENLTLTGRGLHHAILGDPTQFVIDSINAGPGTPDILLVTARTNETVPISIQRYQDQKYKCTYVPKLEGPHLLYVKWFGRMVKGSPFKVAVSRVADSTRVVVDVEGLKEAWAGKDIQTTIDTRSAGRGDLTAECMGPSQLALSRLIDHYDGTFTLLVRPQEHGEHTLRILYNGAHIRGLRMAVAWWRARVAI